MPGELTQAEFYHYYTASQRRVELWVQETNKTLNTIQGQETQLTEKDIISFLPSPQRTQTQLPLPIQPLPTPTPTNLKEQESPTQDVAAGKPPRLSSRSKSNDIIRTPSRHRVHDSRSRPSSGSKKIDHRGYDKHAITKASRSSTRPRGASRHSSEHTPGLAAYIPYGVLPLLFAITGASTLSIVAGIILLSGFVYVEQFHENHMQETRSKKKTIT
ncbi:hypothetical protein M413DRAFT_191880 [Hebeloma cylindrosporum]|uniref:Uncharacterized protein n=1 Tax=Hebeloma cylindrosporum TaxID=76867 RepID=A0A0C3C7A6_HEBCY|nr:hypothetical protein M413DRAFT_191880 [Hebeloma cylindrosporum h7]